MTTLELTIVGCTLVLVGCDEDGVVQMVDPDAGRLATVGIEEQVRALAFLESDLIIATDTSLRRVKLDGSELWRVPRAGPAHVIAARPGLIVAGGGSARPELVAYRDDDGSVAWTRDQMYLSDVLLGADGDVVISTGYDQIFSLDPTSGTERWQRRGPFSEQAARLARDRAGNLAGKYESADPTLYRYDPSGAPLGAWVMPGPLYLIEFEATGELLGASYPSQGQLSPIAYTRFDDMGRATTFVSEAGPALSYYGFAPHADGIFQWHRVTDPGPFTVSSLDRVGTVRWALEIAEQTTNIDGRIVIGPVCDDDGRCAVSEAMGIHVFNVP